jgi:hypothetical protein
MTIFQIKVTEKGLFYISLFNRGFSDLFISAVLRMELSKYQDYLTINFHAINKKNLTFFESKDNAKQALEWVESMYIMTKLKS